MACAKGRNEALAHDEVAKAWLERRVACGYLAKTNARGGGTVASPDKGPDFDFRETDQRGQLAESQAKLIPKLLG